MNSLYENNKYYQLEGFWRKYKDDNTQVDINNNPYPYPDELIDNEWYDKEHFYTKLMAVQKYVEKHQTITQEKNNFKCIYDDDDLGDKIYILNGLMWREDLSHYILKHNIKPSIEFIDRIFMVSFEKETKQMIIPHRIIEKSGLRFLKIDTNQLMILDALMEHGGYTKKYHDPNDVLNPRYSEHAGMLDFDNKTLEKILVSGKTFRSDNYDKDIFLPTNIENAKDYEYIFHTHPPTPHGGGRARQGILYEFPSISDIFHFIEHYETGVTQGSIVITPEGLYNIRKHNFDGKEISIVEKDFFGEIRGVYKQIQNDALAKYGFKFTSEEFYSKIAKDTTYINTLNKTLNKYDIHIDYYPRSKDKYGNYIIKTLYLPVFPYEYIDMTTE
jgi:hypothetical protein